MEWFEAIIGALAGGILTLVSTILYFRPKLREAKAEASKAETEASVAEYSHLLERIKNAEDMYKQQGEMLDKLRTMLLEKKQENYELREKVQRLENENRELTQKVDSLQKDVEAYKQLIQDKR